MEDTPEDKKVVRGRFVKGQSGNPKGGNKPQYIRDYVGNKLEITELYKQNAAHVFFELLKLITSKETPATAKVSAIKEYNDRAYGKPATNIRVSSGNDTVDSIDVKSLDDAVIAQIMAAKKSAETK
ncbi:hypothetical protein [Sphingomonas sp. GB1N7]|uniref:hypothetical protein n=1 Tax=Parasphingomonas caseinilytica TaxID=3096158 RepID=UPI002FCBF38A